MELVLVLAILALAGMILFIGWQRWCCHRNGHEAPEYDRSARRFYCPRCFEDLT